MNETRPWPEASGKKYMHTDNLRIKMTVVMIAAFFAFPAKAGELDQESVNNLMKRKDDIFKIMKAPSNRYEKKGQDRASRIMKKVDSEEYQNRLRAESERLKTTVFKDHVSTFAATAPGSGIAKHTGRLSADERLYVFVSSSVPIQTLRNYAASIDAIGDPNVVMVMRGFIGGMTKWGRMLDFTSQVLIRNPSCDTRNDQCDMYAANLQVDPLLFRRYGVSVVPTVVYARGVHRVDAVMSEGLADLTTVSGFYSIQGDVSLEYILESIKSETKSASIDAVLTALSERRNEGGKIGK